MKLLCCGIAPGLISYSDDQVGKVESKQLASALEAKTNIRARDKGCFSRKIDTFRDFWNTFEKLAGEECERTGLPSGSVFERSRQCGNWGR